MVLNMSPLKMLIAKVVTHKDHDRNLILGLIEYGLFEPIDLRVRAGIPDAKRSRSEEAVYLVLDRIEQTLKSLGLDTNRALGKRIPVDDSDISSSLNNAQEVIRAVESEVTEIDSEIAEANQELDLALSLKLLGIDLNRLGDTDYTSTTAGFVPTGRVSELEWSLKEITDGAVVINSVPTKDGRSLTSVSVPVDKKKATERVMSVYGFETIQVPERVKLETPDISDRVEEKILNLERRIQRLQVRKDSINYEWGPRLLAAWEILDIERRRIEAKSFLIYTGQNVKAWGWIPDGTQVKFELILRTKTEGQIVVTYEEPEFEEVEAPSHISNPSFMKPAQDVVTAFGAPSRHDLDPTKILFFTFPLIFGLMFADLGQGFLVFLIGLYAWWSKRKGDEWGGVLGYIQAGATGLLLMGIFSMIFGLLFGTFFGSETVIKPLWPLFERNLPNGEPNPYRAAHLLKLSIEFGVLHILLGIFLGLYNHLRHNSMRKAIVSFSYLWLYLGFINLIFGISYSDIGSWFSLSGTANLWIPIVGIGYGSGDNGIYPTIPFSPLAFSLIIFIVPLVMMIISSLMGGMDGIVHLMEYGLGMLSHTVSYARIFALFTVHEILSIVFFRLIPPVLVIYFPPVSIFGAELIPISIIHEGHAITPQISILGAVVCTLIVGTLEGLLAFMQALRLHFVEWFSKFFHAGGMAFKPLKIRRIHTIPEMPISSMAEQVAT